MNISSPKAPRSSHHRSSSTRTSPRSSPRHDRVRPLTFGAQDGPTQPPLAPQNLRDQRDETFNVDGGAAILEAGGETYQPPIAPAGRRRFVGGFIGGVRKAWQQRNRDAGAGDAEGLVAYPEPAVVHEEETQYEAVPRAEPEYAYSAPPVSQGQYAASSPPDARLAAVSPPQGHYTSPAQQYAEVGPAAPEGRYAASSPPDARLAAVSPPQVHYASPTSPYNDVGPEADYPERAPHQRQESSSSTSETAHATTQEHYEGTTIVNHEMQMQLGSPQLVEPQPGSDYAKMSDGSSFGGSYLGRLARFIQTVNALPWIAPERVTVDYIPGRARQQSQHAPDTPMARSRKPVRRRTTVSWYNSNVPQQGGAVDLLSGASSTPLDEFAQAKPLYGEEGKYTPPPPAMRGIGMASAPPPPQPQPRINRVPVPQYDPEAGDTYYEQQPRYPNGGYVPYEQLDPQAQTYTMSSVNSVLPPR
ncbi:hypothetical protein C8R46DRAFT_1198317 [Mycena filopes]|nr:hypothetical protein C8R46DRAFT_1198317 [Mycena filopes]